MISDAERKDRRAAWDNLCLLVVVVALCATFLASITIGVTSSVVEEKIKADAVVAELNLRLSAGGDQ